MAQEKPVTDTCICEIKVDINYIILTEIKNKYNGMNLY